MPDFGAKKSPLSASAAKAHQRAGSEPSRWDWKKGLMSKVSSLDMPPLATVVFCRSVAARPGSATSAFTCVHAGEGKVRKAAPFTMLPPAPHGQGERPTLEPLAWSRSFSAKVNTQLAHLVW